MSTHPYSSVRITTNTGPLAQIWLAANMSNLPRNSILQTSIVESADEIAKASGCDNDSDNVGTLEHITLHTSGDLLQGIVRVYSKQAVFLLNDIKDTLTKISSLFKSNQRINVTLNRTGTIARVEQLILEDVVTEREVLVTPDLNFLFESSSRESRLMAKEDSMQRKVQGAAPWDTSLEVGRRFNPDEELEYHQSSALDLDFDIDNGHTESSSKTWEEGTRQTLTQGSENHSSNRESPVEEKFIADDDFPLDDANTTNWDLGISENGEQREDHENDSNLSVEVGRRIGENSNVGAIDFGFDLDIEKEAGDHQRDANFSEIEDLKQSTPNNLARATNRKRTKNSNLVNVENIEIDNDTELSDEQIKRDSVIRTTSSQDSTLSENLRLTKKRFLNDIAQSVGFLPNVVLEGFFSHQAFKRPKVALREERDEPMMNISLGIDEELLQSSIMNSSHIGSDVDDSDHFVPIDADIGQPPVDEDSETSINATENVLDGNRNLSDQIQTQQTQRVRLVTGELASESTVYMAELLRTEFIDNESITFDNVLVAKHNAETHDGESTKPISKREASKGFFEVLSLATAGCIDLDQQVAFEDITIKTRAPLYEKFITV